MFSVCVTRQHCQWLKEKILSEDGKRQQQKLRELAAIAGKLKCSLAQLCIGTTASAVDSNSFIDFVYLMINLIN